MLEGPLRLPVGHLRVFLRVEAEGRHPLGMPADAAPQVHAVCLPERTVDRAHEHVGRDGLG